jgi:ferredoxin-NADP reductase
MPLLALFYLIVPGVQVWFFARGLLMWDVPELINYVSAIVAFQWMLNNVLLSAKIPLLQRSLPYDARIRFHLLGTIGLAATILYHALYKIVLGKHIDIVSWSLLGGFFALVILGIVWIPLPFFKRLREAVQKAVRKGFIKSYDIMKRVHIGFLLAVCALMYYHVVLAHLFKMVPLASRWIYNVCFFGAIAFYLFSKLRNRFLLPAVKVASLESKAGVHTIAFTSAKPLSYRPGQFAFIRFDGPRFFGEEHPFSFLSVPGEGKSSFGIRILGDFTKTMEGLQPGHRAWINAGFGAFHPKSRKKEPKLCFIGSGIGVVPFVSILKEMEKKGDARPIRFFLAVTTEAEIPEYESLKALAARMPNLDMQLLVYERDKTLYSPEYFKAKIADPASYSYYICSSDRVRRVIQDALGTMGVKKKAIHFEAFSFG